MKKSKPKARKPSSAQRPATARPPDPPSERNGAGFPIAGVGASAGGLEAFSALLKHLPNDTGLGFVLVQHLDPQHESSLTQILGRATSMPVHEVMTGLRVEPNHVYVIPPNANLSIARGILKLEPRSSVPGAARSIDFFFEALAQDQREHAIGVILSGTASDGTLGLEAIKAEGGITFAQDDSAKYDSMPRSAVAAGCVDFVLSPADIATELTRIARHPYIATSPPPEPVAGPEGDRADAVAHEDDGAALPSGGSVTRATTWPRADAARDDVDNGADNGYRKILLLLRNHAGVDFSLYKSSTIQRRIARRLVLNKQNALADYAQFLRGNAKELDALYSDVLISVTNFFRNPEAFDVLTRKIFPKLLQQRGDQPLRVWVLGCSTGQEAYSIVMAFMEASEQAPRARQLQVFATDLNEALLDKARYGLYAKSLAQDISPERLRRFFIEEQGGYRVNKTLREMVVFARQNLIGDPPFSRMDLITCRNLLIYLEPSLQKKVMPTFHYALKPEGFLFLGASESISGFTELFEPADKKHKIYSKKAAPIAALHLPVRNERGAHATPGKRLPLGSSRGDAPDDSRTELSAQREADRVTVNQFAPPGVLINAELQILQFRGPTGAYLEPPTGKASFDVLKMARDGLMLPLRTAINKAKKEKNQTVRKEHVRVRQNGTVRVVNVEVIPLRNLHERCFLILFEDASTAGRAAARAPSGGMRKRPADKKAEARRVSELEHELAETRDYLQSMQEQHEATNEELQASNEETQSANEELQSVNEELETSKEELESANEELTTVNEEMANRNAELHRLNSDLTNLQASTQLAIVLLGRDLTVRRFSPLAEKQFHLLAGDIGRPIGNVRHRLVMVPAAGESPPDLEGIIAEVIAAVRAHEGEVRDQDGRWYSLRVRPYFTLDNKVDGAVLVLVDIHDLKRGEQAIASARDYAESIVETVREPLLVLDKELRVESANRSFYRTFRAAPADTIGKLIYDLGSHQWGIPHLRQLLEEVLSSKSSIDKFQVEHDFETIGKRVMLLSARRIHNPQRESQRILLTIEDITERNRAEEALARSHADLRSHAEELTRFNRAAVGRETRIIALKQEVNALRERLGEDARYALAFEDDDGKAPAPEHPAEDRSGKDGSREDGS